MDLRQHLEEQLNQDFELLKELEEKLRSADDPRLKRRWEEAIKDVKQRISERKAELECLANQLVLSSRVVHNSKLMNPVQDNFNNRRKERLQRDLNLAQRQSNELTELINVIVEEISENRGDTVRLSNLRKKKKRYEDEREQHDQEIESLQVEIEHLSNRMIS
jgi:chromosome segregation ATPase